MTFALFIIFTLSALAGASYYLARRFYQGIVCFFQNVKFWPVLLFFCAITLMVILGFARSMLPLGGGVKYVLGIIGNFCMGVLLYLLLFTLLADLILLIPKIIKLSFTTHRFFKGFVAIGIAAATIATCIYGFVNARQIDHVSYTVNIDGKKDISDLNIVMISDLHLGAIGSESKLENTVSEINSLDPDVVCIAGDFFDSDFEAIRDPDAAQKALQKIDSTFGVYACLGNHDAGKSHAQMTNFLNKCDIKLLNEDYVVIDDRLVLVGRLDASPIGNYDGSSRKELSDFFTVNDAALPVVVMDHNPAHIDEYDNTTDLILCGHTHKGQLFPANIITKLIYTVDYGHYQKDADSPHVIVSSGVGYWGVPMRVGTDCEIVSITVTNK